MNLNTPHKPMTGIINAVLLSLGIFAAIGFLLYLGSGALDKKKEPVPVKVECSIIKSNIYLGEGWQILDPVDRPFVYLEVGQGKAEIKSVDNLVECTRYQANTTPVTSQYSLMMWRKT